jgi:hypothetical protein
MHPVPLCPPFEKFQAAKQLPASCLTISALGMRIESCRPLAVRKSTSKLLLALWHHLPNRGKQLQRNKETKLLPRKQTVRNKNGFMQCIIYGLQMHTIQQRCWTKTMINTCSFSILNRTGSIEQERVFGWPLCFWLTFVLCALFVLFSLLFVSGISKPRTTKTKIRPPPRKLTAFLRFRSPAFITPTLIQRVAVNVSFCVCVWISF